MTNKFIRAFTSSCMLGLSGLTTPAAATEQMPQHYIAAMRASCTMDYMSNCMSVNPHSAAAFQCLRRNLSSLSPACQTAVRAVPPPKS